MKFFFQKNSIRSLGGTCVSDALKRAWNLVFSLKVCANVNWHGKKRSGIQKFGLKVSIIKVVSSNFLFQLNVSSNVMVKFFF